MLPLIGLLQQGREGGQDDETNERKMQIDRRGGILSSPPRVYF